MAFVLFGTITAGLGLLAIPTAVTTPPAVAATQASGVIPAPPRPAHQSKLVRARRAGPKVSRTLPDTPRHAHSAHPAKRVRPGRAFHPPAVKEACALPSAVSGVTAKAGANQATLSWTAANKPAVDVQLVHVQTDLDLPRFYKLFMELMKAPPQPPPK